MSLTPPPPPPPPHRPTHLIPSGCKTPTLNSNSRRLSLVTTGSSSSQSVPSPNQLRQILADITKQVTNSPQSRLSLNHPDSTTVNTSMRPSQRQMGPMTRSRSMLRHHTPRSSITPRGTRSNTPIRNENNQFNPLIIQSPRTPFNPNHSPDSRSLLPASPASHQVRQSSNRRNSIAPLRYRTLSSVSLTTTTTTTLSSPTTTSFNSNSDTQFTQQSPNPSSSSTSSTLPSSLRFSDHHSHSSPTPPLTPSSSSNSHNTSNLSDHHLTTLPERRSLDQVDSPSSNQNLIFDNSHPVKPSTTTTASSSSSSSGSLAKRRRRNPSALGRL